MTTPDEPTQSSAPVKTNSRKLMVASSLWVVAALVMALASVRLMEISLEPSLWLFGAVFVGMPAALVAWGVWRAIARDRLALSTIALVTLTAVGFHAASQSLLDVSARLNFNLHRGTYDAVVADARNRRLPATPKAEGWMDGARGGVRYRFHQAAPTVVHFPWVRDNRHFYEGVVYDADHRPGPDEPNVLGEPLGGGYYRMSMVF